MSPTIQIPPLNTPLAERDGRVNGLWSRFFTQTQQVVTTSVAPADAAYWVSSANASLSAERNLGALSPNGYLKITVGAGIAVPSTTATIPATDLSGTLPNGVFPSVLPAASATNLTNLDATDLVGVIPNGAVPNPLPAVSAANLTSLPAANLTGALPAISGAALTALPNPLPAVSGANLTALNATVLTYAVVTVTAAMSPYAILASDSTLLVDATAGAVTVTLPTATAGRTLVIKKVDASANAVTLAGTVDTVVNPTLTVQFQSRLLQADGSAWQILAGYL